MNALAPRTLRLFLVLGALIAALVLTAGAAVAESPGSGGFAPEGARGVTVTEQADGMYVSYHDEIFSSELGQEARAVVVGADNTLLWTGDWRSTYVGKRDETWGPIPAGLPGRYTIEYRA
ncbi:hypothetical protein [Nocardia sp. NPDC052566]|uniref:hypothetical protein n=1 Tax=Nocardia sp. NPDC052566 TaxID=3364330 RepID=UPI0037C9FEC2